MWRDLRHGDAEACGNGCTDNCTGSGGNDRTGSGNHCSCGADDRANRCRDDGTDRCRNRRPCSNEHDRSGERVRVHTGGGKHRDDCAAPDGRQWSC